MKRTATATATALAAGALTATALVSPAAAVEDVTPARIAGADRIDTAVEVAKQRLAGENDTIPTVLLARARDFPDALAGGGLASAVEGLAGIVDAPILLTFSDQLPGATRQALRDFGTSAVVLLGGPNAISTEVEQQLDQEFDVRRVAGVNRFATAAEAARTLVQNNNGLGTINGQTSVIIANGLDFADALAAGSVAYSAGVPVLLTAPGELTPATRSVLQELDPDRALVVGGEQAVSQDVVDTLESDLGIGTQRLAGANRQQTAVQIANFALQNLGYDGQEAVLVRGDQFPDALSGAPQAGRINAPILLTQDADTLSATTREFFAQRCDTIQLIQAIGGESAVSPAVLQEAEQAAESCVAGGGGTTGQTFIVSPQEPVTEGVGTASEFSVGARFDDQTFTGPVTIALFPCENVNVVGTQPVTFTDADDDGLADEQATTDTGSTRVVEVNGQATSQVVVRGQEPGSDGVLRFDVSASAADCAIPTVYEDTDGDGQLDVDAEGRPTEPFGVGKITVS